ncbi:MAG TPA: NAD(P)/FAD-dependent oxidoreductase [Nitrospirae bacterium]|nr:L-2-hydroxyglutarate oxidase LhgO [bacterium BMS3Abin06]HDH13350.1 NAD(P)/FAD-dependent oxidoreductase [Nitrospirota bacterium]HDZ00718.1 NAD(P)/FAD-dependent oxidoreductase [Nitrospirota bacterium]
MEEVEITIIGAGVIGLAIASELSEKYNNIVILEKHDSFGQEISSRNSEVIHTGIYYPHGSLKAKLCIEGLEYLYEICGKYSIAHRKLGKLIVATDQTELIPLEDLFKKGKTNGVNDLALLDKGDIDKIEPNTNAIAAIYSPHTGIIDSHSLMKHFLSVAEDKGVIVSYNSEVELIDKENKGYIVGIKQENYRFLSKILINCSGLSSDYIAALAGIDINKCGYKIHLCKGSYFTYEKSSPVKSLIYPVPHKNLTGLGVHATLDLGFRLRFGPDTEYIDSIDYNVNFNKKDIFYESALKIIPGLEKDAFKPDMAGIRPKLQGHGEKTRDFVITDEAEKGLPSLINLIGIESPGLTAAPAIARMVSGIVSEIMN